jgi:hypothetical protein
MTDMRFAPRPSQRVLDWKPVSHPWHSIVLNVAQAQFGALDCAASLQIRILTHRPTFKVDSGVEWSFGREFWPRFAITELAHASSNLLYQVHFSCQQFARLFFVRNNNFCTHLHLLRLDLNSRVSQASLECPAIVIYKFVDQSWPPPYRYVKEARQ